MNAFLEQKWNFSVKGKRPVALHPILATHVEETPVNSFECIILNSLYALHICISSSKYIMPFCKCVMYMVFAFFYFCPILVLEISPPPDMQSYYTTQPPHVFISVDVSYFTSPFPTDGLSDSCLISVVLTCTGYWPSYLVHRCTCFSLVGIKKWESQPHCWVPSLLAGPAPASASSCSEPLPLHLCPQHAHHSLHSALCLLSPDLVGLTSSFETQFRCCLLFARPLNPSHGTQPATFSQ